MVFNKFKSKGLLQLSDINQNPILPLTIS